MKKIYILFLLFLSVVGFAQEQTMYWIGGTGNWDDLSHWSFQSGSQGVTQPTSIPTPETNIIIDENSGITPTTSFSINLRLSDYTIKSLTINSNTSNGSISIYGSYKLIVEGNVILAPNVSRIYNLQMNAKLGEERILELNGDSYEKISNLIFRNNGTINLNGNLIGTNIDAYSAIINYSGTSFTGGTLTGAPYLNMPNCLSISNFNINGGTLNLPICTSINASYVRGGNFVAPVATSFKAWVLEGYGSITMADDGVLEVSSSFNYHGALHIGNSEVIAHKEVYLHNQYNLNVVRISSPNADKSIILGSNLTINELHLQNHNFDISGNITVNKVFFEPSSNIIFRGNTYFKINEEIFLNPTNCESYSKFHAVSTVTSNTLPKIDNNTGANLTMNDLEVSKINFVGMNPVIVNGVDGGGNQGSVTFIEPQSRNLYWVGNGENSNWDNKDNWSLTSDGLGGSCIPTKFDNVFFGNYSNFNSNNQVIIQNPSSFHDITIDADTPEFIFYGRNINSTAIKTDMICFGSWTSNRKVDVRVSSIRFYSSNLGETIKSSGSYFNTVIINGSGGWLLLDDYKSDGGLIFKGGTLNTNGKKLDIYNFVRQEYAGEVPTLPRNLIISNSEIYFSTSWIYQGGDSQLTALNSHIISRNLSEFRALNGHQYHNLTVLGPHGLNQSPPLIASANASISDESILKFNNVNLYKYKVSFYGDIIANHIKIMPTEYRTEILFGRNCNVNILEIQKNGILKVGNGNTLTINNDFITHSTFCNGLMEITSEFPTDSRQFNFKSFVDISVPNVKLYGVKADLSTGVAYNATGINDGNVSNWNIIEPEGNDLYWIGIEDNKWSNPLNWTFNSDGTPSNGGCIPNNLDRIHFNSFSANAIQGLTVDVDFDDAYVKEIITHSDAPNGIVIQSSLNKKLNIMGNYIGVNNGMNFLLEVNLYGEGNVNIEGDSSGYANFNILNLRTNSTTQTWNFLQKVKAYIITIFGGTVNFSESFYSGGAIFVDNGVLNVPETLVLSGALSLGKGRINAANCNIDVGGFTDSAIITNDRVLDIRNSTITSGRWNFDIWGQIVILAENSYVKVKGSFKAGNNYLNPSTNRFNIVEILKPSHNGQSEIYGNNIFNKLIIRNNCKISGSNTIGTFFLDSKNLTLHFESTNSTQPITQTITDNLFLSGTPCQYNTIKGRFINNSKIAYANPNNNNVYDFVNISHTEATEANLYFDVNSNVGLYNNNKIIKIDGTPGIAGLGQNRLCETSRFIIAQNFYGNDDTVYKWFKKNSNNIYEQLDVPLSSTSIDVRNFGYDGDYKVEVIYNSSEVAELQCKQEAFLQITFSPNNIVFENDQKSFCSNEIVTLDDLHPNQNTLDYMNQFNSTIDWYDSLVGGELLLSSSAVTSGTYYAALRNPDGCESDQRSPITITFNEIPIANAGPDQIIPNQMQFTMQANNPTVGVGTWTVVSGDVTIDNPNDHATTVTHNSGDNARLRWTVDNNGCTSSDDLFIGRRLINVNKARVNPSLRQRVK